MVMAPVTVTDFSKFYSCLPSPLSPAASLAVPLETPSLSAVLFLSRDCIPVSPAPHITLNETDLLDIAYIKDTRNGKCTRTPKFRAQKRQRSKPLPPFKTLRSRSRDSRSPLPELTM
ncbi:hypothetical protein AAFF_G00212020 [Aldrovandia affinis]|uniref:Uncharacterized protein n=1 Tax=Aldrovandia affinis TaxID=143900 RepID=A0AAD7RHC5_9TELE|nr:hypothetical protein AAFF_G00212020 [Aldrovandia affinis]